MTWIDLVLLATGAIGIGIGSALGRPALLGVPLAMLVLLAVMGFVVGSLIGQSKGRTWEGAIVGFVLGPLGWLILRLRPAAGRS